MQQKKIVIGSVTFIVVVAAVLFFFDTGLPNAPSDKGTFEQLEDLIVPRVGEESPEEGVGVPGKIAAGEIDDSGQEYWVFETELADGKLSPFEFRVPVGDLLGISILNTETQEHTIRISGTSEFVPSFIERIIAAGGTASMRTQVLEVGEYDVLCTTCKEQVIGKFVVVPK